jgi:hypothetical protein
MRHQRHLISFCLIMFVSNSHAWQLKMSSCKNFSDIESCSKNCVVEKEKLTVSFIVDKEKNIVMRKVFANGNFQTSLTLQNCRIFDDKNWDCSESKSFVNAEIVTTEKMTNGVYAYALQNLKNGYFSGACGK